MEQVPMKIKPYLIIGGGKMASHLSHYFSMLDIDFYQWKRTSKQPLDPFLKLSTKVLLAVSDDSIEAIASKIEDKLIIHFSGVLSTSYAESAHPLYTFSSSLNDLPQYESIPFVLEKGRKDFSQLFPELKNNSFKIDQNQKVLYHAWASMVGNFSSILINEYSKILKSFSLPVDIAEPYLKHVIKKSLYEKDFLTGPISRGDNKTIEKHLSVIDNNFKPIYRSFVELIKKKKI